MSLQCTRGVHICSYIGLNKIILTSAHLFFPFMTFKLIIFISISARMPSSWKSNEISFSDSESRTDAVAFRRYL